MDLEWAKKVTLDITESGLPLWAQLLLVIAFLLLVFFLLLLGIIDD